MPAPKLAAVVINARDLEAVVAFWSGLLDVGERNRVPGMVWLERTPGAGVSLAVQQVDDPTEGRNRLHLDLGVADLATARDEVLRLGGAELEQHTMGDFTWVVFADPEGNELCMAEADPDDFA